MIAFKTLVATGTGTITFDERHVGGSGGQADWTGYRLDATTNAITVNLPRISLCEGKTLTFVTVNPAARNVVVRTLAGTTDRIVNGSAEVATLTNTTDFGHVVLTCDGFRWFVMTEISFA